MKEEEEMLCLYLGIDYKLALEEYKTNPVMRPLMELCIQQTKELLLMKKFEARVDISKFA